MNNLSGVKKFEQAYLNLVYDYIIINSFDIQKVKL